MKISALVSTYNSERFLSSRLENLLAQTIAAALEIIVVNSGSCQNERKIVEDFQERHDNILYIETQRESLYESWNRALKQATGDYVTNANTDDRLFADSYEVMASVLDECPKAALVYGDAYETTEELQIIQFDRDATMNFPVGGGRDKGADGGRDKSAVGSRDKGGPLHNAGWKLVERPDYSHKNLLLNCLCGPQPMWRRSVHEIHGYFDPSFTVAGDYQLWLRLAETMEFIHLSKPLGLVLANEQGIENANRHLLFEENKRIRQQFFGKPPSLARGTI